MDGHFVPNITVGPPVVRSLRKVTEVPLDCHLMIENPDQYIPEFADAGAEMLAADKCFECGTAIPPRYGYVPMCVPCAIASHQSYLQYLAWSRRLSAMGAKPGRRTKRFALLQAAYDCSTRLVSNDNGRKFGDPRDSRKKQPR